MAASYSGSGQLGNGAALPFALQEDSGKFYDTTFRCNGLLRQLGSTLLSQGHHQHMHECCLHMSGM